MCLNSLNIFSNSFCDKYSKFLATIICVSNSKEEAKEIERNCKNCLLESRPAPSAIFEEIEIKLLRDCDVSPKISSFGKFFETLYYAVVSSTAFFQTSNSLKLCIALFLKTFNYFVLFTLYN